MHLSNPNLQITGTMGTKAAGAAQTASQIQNSQEDRSAPVPRPLHEGEG